MLEFLNTKILPLSVSIVKHITTFPFHHEKRAIFPLPSILVDSSFEVEPTSHLVVRSILCHIFVGSSDFSEGEILQLKMMISS